MAVRPDIYDPLEEYATVFRDKFKQVAQDTFDKLAQEANVDVDANRQTCQLLYRAQNDQQSLRDGIAGLQFLFGLLIVVTIAGVVWLCVQAEELDPHLAVGILATSVVSVFVALLAVLPPIRKKKEELKQISSRVTELRQQAWEQMAALNQLYDWDMLTRMMSQTVPRLEFDDYFTTQRLADLEKTYGWDGSFNEDRSVLYAHSGLINGNPFIICRTKKMEMGTKTYTGSKVIHWTTYERGADGKYHTRYHSQTLTATVTAPCPYYYEKTRVIYGNVAAPDLIFSRVDNDLAGRESSLAYKWERRKLRKKARDLTTSDYAMMTNEEFEVLFNTSNRNNNQQYALLFTPLAQESMLKLMRDEEHGYGDDFDFHKHRMINTIVPQHMQEMTLDCNPKQYEHYDFEHAKANFVATNAEHFRAIYFSLAPLLCVPMYQQIRSHEDIYGRRMKKRSAFWEHEALANFWGKRYFQHPSCVTDCILKTSNKVGKDDKSVIQVTAYGYRTEQHVKYVSRLGGDGYWHNVPVHWDEYIPVTGEGKLEIHEDNEAPTTTITQRERMHRINDILSRSQYRYYRRHIASACR